VEQLLWRLKKEKSAQEERASDKKKKEGEKPQRKLRGGKIYLYISIT